MLWSDERLLLIRQGPPDRPRWMLPGGGVEAGEALKEALERELTEEIAGEGCRIRDPAALIESIAPEEHPSGRHHLHVVFVVECGDRSASELVKSDADVHELRWFQRDELLSVPIHPPIASWLSQWRVGTPFAYFGRLWAP
jgi:ADP-ribose pyrophosphatase YjhB (NUDIX family)